MSQTISKAPRSPQETRTQAWVGMGSHQHLQALVERLKRSVQTADEPLGFVRVSGVSRTRGVPRRAPWAGAAVICAQAMRWRDPGALAGAVRDPFPLPPTASAAGTSRNFSQLFPPMGFSPTINQKEYLNGL